MRFEKEKRSRVYSERRRHFMGKTFTMGDTGKSISATRRWRPFLRSRRWHALGAVITFECGNWRGEVPFSILYRVSNLSAGCFRRVKKSFGEFIARGNVFADGYVYIIDGKTGCRDVIDVGETSYSIPLIDDLSNSGYLSIVLATMNERCTVSKRCAQSSMHPLEGQQSQFLSTNLMTHRNKYFGIYGEDRDYFDVRGEIHDD